MQREEITQMREAQEQRVDLEFERAKPRFSLRVTRAPDVDFNDYDAVFLNGTSSNHEHSKQDKPLVYQANLSVFDNGAYDILIDGHSGIGIVRDRYWPAVVPGDELTFYLCTPKLDDLMKQNEQDNGGSSMAFISISYTSITAQKRVCLISLISDMVFQSADLPETDAIAEIETRSGRKEP